MYDAVKCTFLFTREKAVISRRMSSDQDKKNKKVTVSVRNVLNDPDAEKGCSSLMPRMTPSDRYRLALRKIRSHGASGVAGIC
jgi:hypothetical protein